MTITQMQYFVAVCEYGTISRSAEMLHISQPSISLAIKSLEDEFGVMLFERENKRFQLSEEGKFMYSAVKDILTQIDTLEAQLQDLGRHQNQLCLSVPLLTGMLMLKLFLNGFRHDHPDIPYVIRQYNAQKAFKSLDDGSCDAAIIVEEEKLPVNLETRVIYRSEFVYCVHPDHPLAKESAIHLLDIKNEPIILSQENSYMAKILKSEFYNANSVPNILMYGAQLSLIQDMVSSGQAGTFLIKELTADWPDVAIIPLKNKIPITFSLVWRKDRFLSKRAETLIEYILSKSTLSSQS